jgi:hypothetical protein
MSRQINRLWEIKDGKRYFLLQARHGAVKTGIVKAEVRYHGSPITDRADITFTLQDGDLCPGPSECDYIAELDD